MYTDPEYFCLRILSIDRVVRIAKGILPCRAPCGRRTAMTRLSRRSFVVGSGVAIATTPVLLASPAPATQPVTVAAADAAEPYKFSLVGAADSPIPGGMVHRANKAAFPILS